MKQRNSGFTLVELMITLVVAAVLLTVGIPSFRTLIQNNKAIAQANHLVAALNYARSEALKRRAQVILCSMNAAQNACDNGNTDWGQNGWMAFADTNNNNAYDAGADTLLRSWRDTAGLDDINITGTAASIGYLQTGRLSGGAAIGLLVNVDEASESDRCVWNATTGRVESKKMTAGVTCP